MISIPRSNFKFNTLARAFHWGFIALFVFGIVKQVDDISQLADPSFYRFELVFGLLFLVIVILRYLYMQKTGATALSEDAPSWIKRAAHWGHIALYVTLALIPISGLMISALYLVVPSNGFLMEATIGLHEVSITACYWLIGLHIAAAIYHLILNDGVWSAMVPFIGKRR